MPAKSYSYHCTRDTEAIRRDLKTFRGWDQRCTMETKSLREIREWRHRQQNYSLKYVSMNEYENLHKCIKCRDIYYRQFSIAITISEINFQPNV